jgi:NUMOD3 motif
VTKSHIYALLDESRRPRYVGVTDRHPECRAWEHWGDAHYRGYPADHPRLDWLLALDRAPEVWVLQTVPSDQGLKAEAYWIDLLGQVPSVSLLNRTRPGMTGKRHTEATRAKMTASHTGKNLSPEHRAAIAAALKGKPKSAAHRVSLGVARSGTRLTDEQKAARAASYAKGWAARRANQAAEKEAA